MFKKPLFLTAYTLLVILISALSTTAYFHYVVLIQDGPESLIAISEADSKNSPITDDNSIIEIFSYGCHYCALNDEHMTALAARMPPGTQLIPLHINNDQQSGLASFAPLFATLTVMGIEPQHRKSAYNAVVRDKINLSDPAQRDTWLTANGIDVAAYTAANQTPQVKTLLTYMTAVSKHHNIIATPMFIVNKKWVAMQDREFPAFSDQLLSLLQHDKPLEK